MRNHTPIGQEGIARETGLNHAVRCGDCGESVQVRVTDDGRFIVGCPTAGHDQFDIGQLEPSETWEAEL